MVPIERTLTFRIDACPGSPLIAGSPRLARGVASACVHDPDVHAYRREVVGQFGLKGVTWAEMTLGESARPFLDFMADRARGGFARFGAGILVERPAATGQAAWCRVVPPLRYNNRWRKVAAVEVMHEHGRILASSRFRAAVEAGGLRGLVFDRLESGAIPGDRRAWFSCRPTALSGRGLDQPWAPPLDDEATGGHGRLGATRALSDSAIRGRLDPAVAELCDRFPPGELDIVSFPRLWAAALPDADFAGVATGLVAKNSISIEAVLVRRSAAEALIRAGVLDPAMLEPVDVVDNRASAGVPILDEEFGPLPSALVERVAARVSVPDPGEPFNPPPAPRAGPMVFARGPGRDRISPAEVDAAAGALGVEVPPVWRRFMNEVGVGEYLHPEEWVADRDAYRDEDQTLPARMLVVGDAGNGDEYALDLDRVTPDGDCPVLFFDHEVSACVDWWPSAFEFVNATPPDRDVED